MSGENPFPNRLPTHHQQPFHAADHFHLTCSFEFLWSVVLSEHHKQEQSFSNFNYLFLSGLCFHRRIHSDLVPHRRNRARVKSACRAVRNFRRVVGTHILHPFQPFFAIETRPERITDSITTLFMPDRRKRSPCYLTTHVSDHRPSTAEQ